MTAIVAGLGMAALSPVSGVQLLGVIIALCGFAWVAVKRLEKDA